MPTDNGRLDQREYIRRVLIAVGVTVAVFVLLLLLWHLLDMLLLIFSGILVAVLLRAPALLLARHTPLSDTWSVTLVLVTLALLLGFGGRLAAGPVMDQLNALSATLPQMVDNIKQQMANDPWGERLVRQAESINWTSPRMNILGRMTGALSTAFGFIADAVIIIFLGIYFAIQPGPYIRGLVSLIPLPGRHRGNEVLHSIGHTLRWWLVGKLISMTVVGLLTWVGLWLLGMPLAIALALLAGLFSFVPYLGPIVSAIPAVLLAFTEGPQQVLYVLLVYLAVQTVESYLLTPIVQQQAVDLPVAMILTAQIMLGFVAGGMGVVLATPVAAMVLVMVRMLYIEDVLGDEAGGG